MAYLVHTAHAQFVGMWLSGVGWILTVMTLGLIQWRVWLVDDRSVISSGVAWVGIWRVCFYSRTLPTPTFKVMYCRGIGLAEDYTPPEIAAAQVLMLAALASGFLGNAGAVYAMRNVYFGLEEKDAPIRRVFAAAGGLCLMTAAVALVPLLWNLNSVVTNQTIRFPPDFYMPPAPVAQHMGPGIWVGLVGSALLIISGIIFLSYRLPDRFSPRVEPSHPEEGRSDRVHSGRSLSRNSEGVGAGESRGQGYSHTHSQARDNPAFLPDETV